MKTFRAEELTHEERTLQSFPIHVLTYRLLDRYHCKVDNVSPGALIARASGATREEALALALGAADRRLAASKAQREARQVLASPTDAARGT